MWGSIAGALKRDFGEWPRENGKGKTGVLRAVPGEVCGVGKESGLAGRRDAGGKV